MLYNILVYHIVLYYITLYHVISSLARVAGRSHQPFSGARISVAVEEPEGRAGP